MESSIIFSDRDIEIRRLAISEAHLLADAIQSSSNEIGKWEGWCTPGYGISDALDFLDNSSETWAAGIDYNFNVIEKTTGSVIGSVAVNRINRIDNCGNIGYWTRSSHVRQGIASIAAKAATRFAFRELRLTRVEIVAQESNRASQRVAEKAGAVFECIARNRLYFRGEPRHAAVYSLVPEADMLNLPKGFL